MRHLKLCYFLALCLQRPIGLLHAQSIGGVINSYYKVVEIIPSKACVRVSSTVGLAQYDNTMLVQMKGATVSTTNNATYGSITALNNVGKYEMGIVCAVNGDSVFFEQTLLNSYDVTDKVQLVYVPSFASVTITSPLLAAPWDNSAGTGGVLGLIAINTLTLNANVSADTMGFKGGPVKILNGACGIALQFSSYAYNPNSSTGGAYKGEGIADVTAANSGGRGPMGNGGGGGNDHNNGAGGGSNLAAGGAGGSNNSTTGCNNKYPGLGGWPLSNTGSRIYLGGGGGHGHSNNTTTAYGGGNGGGIVYISAGTLAGNGFSISASGEDGSANIGDGGAGGGAGGTILMEVGSYTGTVNISANGGKGGDVDNLSLSNRSMGPGGGAAGGAVYFTGTLPGAAVVSVSGGAAGASYNTSPAGLAGNNGAVAGTNGTIAGSYPVARSGTPSAYCSTILLPVSLLYFDGLKEGGNARLYWKMAPGAAVKSYSIEYSADASTWSMLEEISANDDANGLSRLEPLPETPLNYYRLKMTGINNEMLYSSVAVIRNDASGAYLSVYPNPAGRQIGLHSSLRGRHTFQLYSTDGKQVWRQDCLLQNGEAQIALPPLRPGLYILSAAGRKARLLIR